MTKQLLENPVLTLNSMHNDLHHFCAVAVGVIYKISQSAGITSLLYEHTASKQKIPKNLTLILINKHFHLNLKLD